jgi:hypothetical protein
MKINILAVIVLFVAAIVSANAQSESVDQMMHSYQNRQKVMQYILKNHDVMNDFINQLVTDKSAQNDLSKQLMKNKDSREYMMEQMFYIAKQNPEFYTQMHDFMMQNNKIMTMMHGMVKGSRMHHAMMKMNSNNN